MRILYRNNRDLSFPQVLDSKLAESNIANNNHDSVNKLNKVNHDFSLDHFTHDDRDDGESTGSMVISFASLCKVTRKSGRPIADITNSLKVNSHNDHIHES